MDVNAPVVLDDDVSSVAPLHSWDAIPAKYKHVSSRDEHEGACQLLGLSYVFTDGSRTALPSQSPTLTAVTEQQVLTDSKTISSTFSTNITATVDRMTRSTVGDEEIHKTPETKIAVHVKISVKTAVKNIASLK